MFVTRHRYRQWIARPVYVRKPGIADGDSCTGSHGLIAIGVVSCLAGVEPFGKVFYPVVDSKDVYEISQPYNRKRKTKIKH